MSQSIHQKLLNETIEAIEAGDLNKFKEVFNSELHRFSEYNLDLSALLDFAAIHNKEDIVDYLVGQYGFDNITSGGTNAMVGYCKSGNYDAFMKMLERFMPHLKLNQEQLNAKNCIVAAIKYNHVDMARKLISAFSLKPYTEYCSYGSKFLGTIIDHPYRELISVCLKFNCVELLDELFEKASISKDEINFENVIAVAKALKYDEFVKKLEEWKEKYPYQPKSENDQSSPACFSTGTQLMALPWVGALTTCASTSSSR